MKVILILVGNLIGALIAVFSLSFLNVYSNQEFEPYFNATEQLGLNAVLLGIFAVVFLIVEGVLQKSGRLASQANKFYAILGAVFSIAYILLSALILLKISILNNSVMVLGLLPIVLYFLIYSILPKNT